MATPEEKDACRELALQAAGTAVERLSVAISYIGTAIKELSTVVEHVNATRGHIRDSNTPTEN